MTTKVIFNVDAKAKVLAMKEAKKQGLTLSYFLSQTVHELAQGERRVEVVETLNKKTVKSILQAKKDFKAGKNTSPTFTDSRKALQWLHSK